MNTTCYFCKGHVLEGSTDVDFWWGDALKIIEKVPARICEQCGEKYFDAEVYRKMERLAQGDGKAQRQMSVDVMRFTAA